MRVSRRVGIEDEDDTETVGASPPTGGTVIMNTFRFTRTNARRPSGDSTTSSGVPLPRPDEGALTFTTVRTSVPSKRIDKSPSLSAHT